MLFIQMIQRSFTKHQPFCSIFEKKNITHTQARLVILLMHKDDGYGMFHCIAYGFFTFHYQPLSQNESDSARTKKHISESKEQLIALTLCISLITLPMYSLLF